MATAQAVMAQATTITTLPAERGGRKELAPPSVSSLLPPSRDHLALAPAFGFGYSIFGIFSATCGFPFLRSRT